MKGDQGVPTSNISGSPQRNSIVYSGKMSLCVPVLANLKFSILCHFLHTGHERFVCSKNRGEVLSPCVCHRSGCHGGRGSTRGKSPSQRSWIEGEEDREGEEVVK